jgi:hypothetical protein
MGVINLYEGVIGLSITNRKDTNPAPDFSGLRAPVIIL